jgi:hypothetical protein
MKFTLTTSGYFYPVKKVRKKLESLGFTFKKDSKYGYVICGKPKIYISSLKDLLKFVKKYGDIVLRENDIEIYDYYRE